ncbi:MULTISPECIES: RAQPRD family integrative conjugative element protein [unclassified Pseudomonas]|uniref:integrative conjugative element protein, RAQPRD family n=1 Tax=unclassified Pseudomonas TaxID=196821 RepID=UPI0025E707F5|nr:MULTISPECIES: RAQPRD family integrative conjugative element protein [unclassified Pseudomonas]
MIRHPYLLVFACLVTLSAEAEETNEFSKLGLIQQQISVIEQLADGARSSSTNGDGARYRLDYSRLTADLDRVRHGIHQYLSPSRAQPADLIEGNADYRVEVLHVSSSHEHD